MIFQTPPVNRSIARRLTELDELRTRLGSQAGIAGPWLAAFAVSGVRPRRRLD